MTNSKSTKRALFTSALAMLMCVAMLIGTTFAWFTDTASTAVNKIQSGTLDVELWQAENDEKLSEDALKWVKAEEHENDTVLWEPGCTYNLESFRIKNNGNLALKYKVIISGIIGDAKLLDAIDFTVKIGSQEPVSLANWDGKLAASAVTDAITITGTMKTTAGNEYQNLTIDGISITVVATQDTVEYDSNGNTYDALAQYPVYTVADVTTNTDGNKTVVASEVTIESEEKTTVNTETVSVATATIPANVVLDAGTTQVKLVVEDSKDTNNISITSDQAKKTLEVKLEGVRSDNTVPATVSFYIEKGLTGLKLYHNGAVMTKVDSDSAVVNDQEYYYDSATGKITMKSATFSPFTYVYNAPEKTATVTTAEELTAALKNTNVSNIVLTNSIETGTLSNATYTATIDNKKYENLPVIDHSVTIDLNENTLTYTGERFGVVNSGSVFTMKNGTFKENNANLKGVTGVIVNFEGTTTTLEKVTATTDAALLFPWGNASSVNVIDSKITAGVYGVATNAGNGSKTGITINISNSEITTTTTDYDNCAVLMNVGGNVYITNSTIVGDRQGFILRAGYAEVKHSTIKTTGKWAHGDKNAAGTKAYWKPDAEGNSDYWGTGNEVPRAALVVGTRDNTASSTWLGYSAKCYVTDSSTIVDESNVHNIVIGWSNNSCGYCEQDSSSFTTNIALAD